MKRIIRLNESDLTQIVRRIIKETTGDPIKSQEELDKILISCFEKDGYKKVDSGGKVKYKLQKKQVLPAIDGWDKSGEIMHSTIFAVPGFENKAAIEIRDSKGIVFRKGIFNVDDECLQGGCFYFDKQISDIVGNIFH
jgi:hypothetical protein